MVSRFDRRPSVTPQRRPSLSQRRPSESFSSALSGIAASLFGGGGSWSTAAAPPADESMASHVSTIGREQSATHATLRTAFAELERQLSSLVELQTANHAALMSIVPRTQTPPKL